VEPAADVYRTGDGWLVKVDVAGICADELEIDLDQANLRVRVVGATQSIKRVLVISK